jgi:hypothetical protein
MDVFEVSDKGEYLYTRTFESMGKGLFLMRVDNIHKVQSPYHYLFENGKKPPFDIAINPMTKRICYFKFFLQDEKFETSQKYYDLENTSGEPVFSVEPFDETKYQVYKQAEFESFYNNNNLIIIRKECNPQKAIKISIDIKVLINNQNDFAGVIFESISEQDISELKKSEVIG